MKEEFKILKENLETIVDDVKKSKNDKDSLANKVLIRPHDKPDPDAISSAIALSTELRKYNTESIILFHRESPFYENQALHNLLDLKTTSRITRLGTLKKNLGEEEFEKAISSINNSILVDTSTIYPSSLDYKFTKPKLIIDHHNGNHTQFETATSIVPDSGANISFILAYMLEQGLDINLPEHQALKVSSYIGIETDTSGFMPELMRDLDRDMKSYLDMHLTDEDKILIEKVKSPEINRNVKRLYGDALKNHSTYRDDKLVIYAIPNVVKDGAIIPYVTDRFFREDKLGKAIVVFGICDYTEDDVRYLELMASGRSLDPSMHMPELFEETFYLKGPEGKRQKYSGGSSISQTGISRAGATIPLHEYEEYPETDLEKLWEIEQTKYTNRILKKFPKED